MNAWTIRMLTEVSPELLWRAGDKALQKGHKMYKKADALNQAFANTRWSPIGKKWKQGHRLKIGAVDRGFRVKPSIFTKLTDLLK